MVRALSLINPAYSFNFELRREEKMEEIIVSIREEIKRLDLGRLMLVAPTLD